jgi:hypothetical protein
MTKERPILEVTASSENEDCVLAGLFSVLSNILAQRPDALKIFEEGGPSGKHEFLLYLMNECLFYKDTKRAIV